MLTFGNEREIQQGEEWNLDILVSQSNTEYIPFIVSSERASGSRKPMFALTVASTKYEKNERYVATWWLDLLKGDGFTFEHDEQLGLTNVPLPLFFQTVPQPLFVDGQGNPIDKTDNMPITKPAEDDPMECLYYYTKASDSIDKEVGHKPYYYVYFTAEDPNTPREDYECRIRMQFKTEETVQWGSQNYMYQITLVDTIPMALYIQEAKDRYPNLNWPVWVTRDDPNWIKPTQNPGESIEDYNARVEASWLVFRDEWIMTNVNELYTFIKNRIPGWFSTDIDMDAPVGYINVAQVIMPPTKLQVNNNLRKLI